MKKFILFSALAFILVVSICSITGASFLNSKPSTKTDNLKKVIISTSFGDIKIKLYDDTPKHRDNFIKLVKEAYYDGTIFHRVIKNFMIQGGDPDSKTADSSTILGSGGPSYTIPAEIIFDTITENTTAGVVKHAVLKHTHKKGALAAARTDNPAKASSGSQFYIVQGKVFSEATLKNFQSKFKYTADQIKEYTTIGGYPPLDGSYTVFGEVYEGLDVIDKIAAVQTSGDPYNRPKKDVKMTIKITE
jgi:cyclophilin family peptidyl-prolyl cis-trans isomerase